MLDGAPLDLPDELFGWLEWVRLASAPSRRCRARRWTMLRCQATGAGSAPPGALRLVAETTSKILQDARHRGARGHGCAGARDPAGVALPDQGADRPQLVRAPGRRVSPDVETAYPVPGAAVSQRAGAADAEREVRHLRAPIRRGPTIRTSVVSRSTGSSRESHGGAGPAERLSRPDPRLDCRPSQHRADPAARAPAGGRPGGRRACERLGSTRWQRLEAVLASPFGQLPATPPPGAVYRPRPPSPRRPRRPGRPGPCCAPRCRSAVGAYSSRPRSWSGCPSRQVTRRPC